ncbi:MAG: hypothetical protein RLY35_917 [Bacteroidota bacterium]|jgi:hypothetical protein
MNYIIIKIFNHKINHYFFPNSYKTIFTNQKWFSFLIALPLKLLLDDYDSAPMEL